MEKSSLKCLLVEDNEADKVLIYRTIKKLNDRSSAKHISLSTCSTLQEALDSLHNNYDIILLDLSLPDASMLEGLLTLQKHLPPFFPIVVLTGEEDENIALKVIKAGAQDYLLKREISDYSLSRSVMYALERSNTGKQLEEMRISQAKNLKMAALGEMAGGIAHEINNPLSIITGYANRIKRKTKSKLNPEETIECATKIEETTNRIAKIVKSLRAFSYKEDREQDAPISIKDVIHDTLNLCTERFRASAIDIQVGDISDEQILGRDIQLTQVLLNLLNNSFDAVKSLDEKWIKIHTEASQGHLNIYITDSGLIIDETIKMNMFTPFFTTKEKGDGTGLGMSISRNIIKSHKGHIEYIDGQENTTFKVSLPLAQANLKSATSEINCP